MLARDTLEDGFPVHDGKGDIRKCPFYTAQQDKGRLWVPSSSPGVGMLSAPSDTMFPIVLHTGALEGNSCPFRTAISVLRKPSLQLILATSVALAAGLLAWYYI